MFEVIQRYFDFNGINIAYTQTGPRDGRVLFCVHGLLSNGRDYDFLALELAKHGYLTIAMDLPGRGKSDKFHDHSFYNITSYLPFCVALVTHVTEGRPFDWLGVSLGGMIGMSLHNMDGVNMERLILVDIGPEISGEALDMVSQLARRQPYYNDINAAVMALKTRCTSWGITDNAIWEHLIEHNIKQDTNGLYTFHYDSGVGKALPQVSESVQFWEVWEQIKQPVLVIRGGMSFILTAETLFNMEQHYKGKGMDKVVFDQCGHVPNLMQDDHIAAIVDWLK